MLVLISSPKVWSEILTMEDRKVYNKKRNLNGCAFALLVI